MSVTVITAVDPERAEHLPAAADSILDLKRSLETQWIVAWDGLATSRDFGDLIIEGRQGSGISCTRNLSLPFIEGQYVFSLDADDLLEKDGPLSAVRVLKQEASLGWVGLSRTLIDGTETAHTVRSTQRFEPGVLAEFWTAPFVFHPNSFLMRSELLLEIGGWPALTANEDLLLTLLASENRAGVVIPNVGTRYRVWNRQEVARKDYPQRKMQSFQIIEAIINAQRRRRGAREICAPTAPGGSHGVAGR